MQWIIVGILLVFLLIFFQDSLIYIFTVFIKEIAQIHRKGMLDLSCFQRLKYTQDMK